MDIKSDNLKLNGIYRGQVVDNNDPNKWGRIKLNVFGLFDGVDTDQLMWAKPGLPIFSGSGSGYGWFAVPEIGSYVFVFFEAGDVYQPVYFAEAPNGLYGHPTIGDTNYPNRRGFKTKSGNLIYVDDIDGTIRIQTSSGAYINITGNNINITGNNVTLTGALVTLNGVVNNVGGSSGTFQSKDDKTVVVLNGVVMSIT